MQLISTFVFATALLSKTRKFKPIFCGCIQGRLYVLDLIRNPEDRCFVRGLIHSSLEVKAFLYWMAESAGGSGSQKI